MLALNDNKRLAVMAVAAALAGAGIGTFFILSTNKPAAAPEVVQEPERIRNEPTPAQKAELQRRAAESYARRQEAERLHSTAMELGVLGDKGGQAYMLQHMQNEADAKRPPAEYRDYQVVGTYSVTGYADEDGTRGDHFEGCDYGRMIILNDSQSLTCKSYQYAYEYAPRAEVLRNGSDYVMIVNGVAYRMQR